MTVPTNPLATELDGRSDLYSLGCVLYEMLVGAPPFSGPTVQAVLARRFMGPPPDASATRESVPAAVSAVARQMMATDAGDRFSTGALASHALASCLSPGPGSSGATRAIPPTLDRLPRLAVLPFSAPGGNPVLTEVADARYLAERSPFLGAVRAEPAFTIILAEMSAAG